MKKTIIAIIISVAAVAAFAGAGALYNGLIKTHSSNQLQTLQDNNSDKNKNDGKSPSASQPDSEPSQNPTAPPSSDSGTPQNPAPDFTVKDKDNNEVRLSDYFGKPIVLNFWATWCPYCIQEMPYFDEVSKGKDDVTFIMLNTGETIAAATEFLKDTDFTFPVLYDEDSEAALTYGVNALPMTFFIDKNGELIAYSSGLTTKEMLTQGIGMITQ